MVCGKVATYADFLLVVFLVEIGNYYWKTCRSIYVQKKERLRIFSLAYWQPSTEEWLINKEWIAAY